MWSIKYTWQETFTRVDTEAVVYFGSDGGLVLRKETSEVQKLLFVLYFESGSISQIMEISLRKESHQTWVNCTYLQMGVIDFSLYLKDTGHWSETNEDERYVL